MDGINSSNGTLVKKDEALIGAAVSAAVGVAVYGLRKALAERGGGLSLHRHDAEDAPSENDRSGSLLVTVLESASDSLLPFAEDAAEAAGKWAARNSPTLVRERLLPRFIDSFRAAA
jgi:hypothetical protein